VLDEKFESSTALFKATQIKRDESDLQSLIKQKVQLNLYKNSLQ